MGKILRDELTLFMAALMFYTRLPTPKNLPHSDEILNRSRKYFSAIGLIIGLLSAFVFCLSSIWLPASVSVVVMMIVSVLLTGAFHEDGFADSCDGFGGGWSTEQVLTIMKDSRLGTYGAIGLFGILTLKYTSLLNLSQESLLVFSSVCVAAHMISRQLSSLVIEFHNYVQDIDVSKVKPITDRKLNRSDSIISLAITAAGFGCLFLLAPIASVIALSASALIAIAFARYSKRRIGGYTGDVLGAIQQLSEAVFYLSLVALL